MGKTALSCVNVENSYAHLRPRARATNVMNALRWRVKGGALIETIMLAKCQLIGKAADTHEWRIVEEQRSNVADAEAAFDSHTAVVEPREMEDVRSVPRRNAHLLHRPSAAPTPDDVARAHLENSETSSASCAQTRQQDDVVGARAKQNRRGRQRCK